MLSRSFSAALAGMSMLLAPVLAGDTTNTILMSTPTAQPTNLRAIKSVGCYSTAVPMINHGPHIYQSSGNCQKICYLFQNTAMAMGNGTDCWCGDFLPPKSAKVDDAKCSTGCAGWPEDKCGGGDVWSVYLTGFSLNDVPNYDKSSSNSASTTSKATASASASSNPSGGGSNTVGIVAGVVVGIVAVAGIGLGVFFFLRRKQQREMDDYKRQNDVSSFVGGGKVDNTRPQMWAPDNRLDTAAGGNRLSNGSIADNQDYSRKILQVRNPDGF